MKCQIIQSGTLSPEKIMAKDAELLQALQTQQQPVLHFYEWEGKCLTYGHFTNPFDYLEEEYIQKEQLRMARRPTGGGIIFHLTDLAFSILVPAVHPRFSINSLENYAFINSMTAEAISAFTRQNLKPQLCKLENCTTRDIPSFCMAKPTCYDLMVGGKKVGGAAQRRTKWGYLHQGSISLCLPPLSILEKVVKEKLLFEAMQKYTYCLFSQELNVIDLQEGRYALKEEIKKNLIGHLYF